MNWKRLLPTVLLGLLTGFGAVAQTSSERDQPVVEPAAGETAAADPGAADTEPGTPQPGAPPDTASSETTDPISEPQPTVSTTRRRAGSRNFRPSEEITADNSVAYPVDI